MSSVEEKKFVIELLRLYRTLPALWDTNHEDYNNYFKKHQQYERLLEKYRETYPNGYMRDLKGRITRLRNGYKAELRRMSREKAPAESNLYYFKELSFLNSKEILQDYRNSNEEGKTALYENMTVSPSTSDSFYQILQNNNIETEEIEIKPDLDLLLEAVNARDSALTKLECEPEQIIIKNEIFQQSHPACTCNQELPNIENQQNKDINLPVGNCKKKRDTPQPLCSLWYQKLTKVDTSQRILAEKLINDVLVNAELGLLNLNTSLTNLSFNQSVPIAKKENVK